MNPAHHKAAHCQSGSDCNGPGCRVKTGKTERKASGGARPHYNKRNLTPKGEKIK